MKALGVIRKEVKWSMHIHICIRTFMYIHINIYIHTTGRMKALGVIRKEVKWSESRTYFYWRLRRRLIEFEIANSLKTTAPPVVGMYVQVAINTIAHYLYPCMCV
jgi:hypothetical protein